MGRKSKYSKEIKDEICKKYFEGKKVDALVKEYDLSSAILLYSWIRKYKQNNYQKLNLSKYEKKCLEVAALEKQIKKLKEKNAKIAKNEAIIEKRNEFLKKYVSSGILKNQSSLTKELKTKRIKLLCYKYIEEYKSVYSISYMCSYLPISRKSYYAHQNKEWKFDRNQKAMAESRKNKILKLVKLVDDEVSSVILSDINEVKYYIDFMMNEKVGKNLIYGCINQIYMSKQSRFFKKHKTKTDRHEDYLFDDKICKDYSTTTKMQKIGLDGTWFKGFTINGIPTNLMAEMIYDWNDHSIIAYNIDTSENAELVDKTIRDALPAIKKAICFLDKKTIIQMDRGRANASKTVNELLRNSISCLEPSMSESGFRHNSITESLNGWVKEKFAQIYGKDFKSESEFKILFARFVEKWNLAKSIRCDAPRMFPSAISISM